VTANGRVIAHGEVVAQDGRFALRIVSLAGDDAAAAPAQDAAVSPQVPSLDEAGTAS